MTPVQLKASQILLDKSLPNLTATEFQDVTPDMGTPQDAIETMHTLMLETAKKGSKEAKRELLDALMLSDPALIEQTAEKPSDASH